MKYKAIVPLLLVFIAASAAQGSDKNYEALYGTCMKGAGDNTSPAEYNSVMDGCANDTSSEAKKEINALYDRLYSKVAANSLEDANRLEQSQKAWVIYRNGECDLEGAYVGSPARGQCLMLLNIRRVNELRELVGQ